MSYAPELYDPVHILGYTGSISEGTSVIYFQMPLPYGQDVRLAVGRISTSTAGEQGRALVLAGNDFQIEETPAGTNFLLDGIIVYQDDEPFISVGQIARGQLADINTNNNFQHLLNSHESLHQAIKANLNSDLDGMPFIVKAVRAYILANKIVELQEDVRAVVQAEGTLLIDNSTTVPGLHQLAALAGEFLADQNSGVSRSVALQSGSATREYPEIGIPGSQVGFSQLSNLVQQFSVGSNSNTGSSDQELPQASEVSGTTSHRVRGPGR